MLDSEPFPLLRSTMTKLVVLANFSLPIDANIAKSNLDSVGIPAFIADELTINMQWGYSVGLGGVRLFVAEENVEFAYSVINQDFSSSVDLECETKPEYCHSCKSDNVQLLTKIKKSAFFVLILLGFPLFFFKHGIICNDCNSFRRT